MRPTLKKYNPKSFKSIVMSFDLFGKSLMFEENNEQKLSTCFGTVVTVLMLISIIVMSFMFGKDIYQRNNPTLMLSELIVRNDIAFVNQRENPLMFFFMDDKTELLDDDPNSIFTIRTTYLHLNENITPNRTYYYGINKCNPDNYVGQINKDLVQSKVSLFPVYCIDHDLDFVLRGTQNKPDSYSIVIDIFKCDEEFRENNFYYDDFNGNDFYSINSALSNKTYMKNSHRDIKCKTTNLAQSNKFYFSLVYHESFFNYKEYKDNLITQPYSYTKIMSNELVNYLNLRYVIQELITDNGWLLENNIVQKKINIQSIIPEVYIPDKDKEIITLKLDVSNNYDKTYRSYIKVQDLFAKIGGLFNPLLISIKILLSDYVDFKYRKNYIEFSIDNQKMRKITKEQEKYETIKSKPEIENYKDTKEIKCFRKSQSESHSQSKSQSKSQSYENFDSLNALNLILNNSNCLLNTAKAHEKDQNNENNINYDENNNENNDNNNENYSSFKKTSKELKYKINSINNLNINNNIMNNNFNVNTKNSNNSKKNIKNINSNNSNNSNNNTNNNVPSLKVIKVVEQKNLQILKNNFINSKEDNSQNIQDIKITQDIQDLHLNFKVKKTNNDHNYNYINKIHNKYNTLNLDDRNHLYNNNQQNKFLECNNNHTISKIFFQRFRDKFNFEEKELTTKKKLDIVFYTNKLTYLSYCYYRYIECCCCCWKYKKYKTRSKSNIITKLINSSITREKYSLSSYLNNIQKLKNLEDNFNSFQESSQL